MPSSTSPAGTCDESGAAMAKEDRKWLFGSAAALVAVVAAVAALFRVSGLVGGGSGDAGLGAVVTLAGVMITALVSMIGILVNRQAERRLAVHQAEERERLRLDAAMRAGSLFQASASGAADPAAVASGLLALTQLDRADLAVALLVDLWDSDEPDRVSTETAIQVLNAALSSSDPNAQLIAAELLCRNAPRLEACQSLHWPSAIDGRWRPEFGLRTKLLLVDALFRMTCTSEPNENALRFVVLRLFGIWSGDPSDRIKGCIGRLIESLIPALEGLGYSDFMQDPRPVTLGELKVAASSAMGNPDGLLERIVTDRSEKLALWSKGCRVPVLAPGSLASTLPSHHGLRFGRRRSSRIARV